MRIHQKTYWLNTQPFPEGVDPKAFLSELGITFPKETHLTWEPTSHQLFFANTPENHSKLCSLITEKLGGILGSPSHWLLLTNGARIALNVSSFGADNILGMHPTYGRCSIPVNQIYEISNFQQPPPNAWKSLESWDLIAAQEPVSPESGGENSSLLGTPAKPFKLPLLRGGDFDLTQEKGKVVILDFWATWCGPCVKAVPDLIEALTEFSKDQFRLIGLNQGESAEEIQRFLTAKNWALDVALDRSQSVGKQFGVEGIPHTVIIGPDGKVAWVKTGYTAEGAKEAADTVRKLLEKK